MSPILLVALFVVSAVLGYIIIRNVPALLQTPLMSGMNALSGVTVLGAMVAAFHAKTVVTIILALLAAGRIQVRPLVSRVVKPQQAPEIYTQLCDDPLFPMGTVFDWR